MGRLRSGLPHAYFLVLNQHGELQCLPIALLLELEALPVKA